MDTIEISIDDYKFYFWFGQFNKCWYVDIVYKDIINATYNVDRLKREMHLNISHLLKKIKPDMPYISQALEEFEKIKVFL